jgi:hypothetical protein
LRILPYAEKTGRVARSCRYFGVGRSSFYRWHQAYAERGAAGPIDAPPIPKWHANRTPPEREEKGLSLRRKYHLGPIRIAWHLERYHVIEKIPFRIREIRTDNGHEFHQLLGYKGDVDLEAKRKEWGRFSNLHRPQAAHAGKTPYEALREKL